LKLFVHAAALRAAIQAQMFLIHQRVRHKYKPSITCGQKSESNRERMTNLNYIYNNNDVEFVSMPRMRRTPFCTTGS
jgi:hypothetical protein